LPVNDVVRADDVQNVRAFGGTQAESVMQKVEDKLADGKLALEMTREHMQLGALLGKVLDADGSEIVNIYTAFGMRRNTYEFDLANPDTEVGRVIDETVTAQRKLLRGTVATGYIALCSPEFIGALKYHPKIKPLYERYRDGAIYREADINRVEFEHNGIRFIQYDGGITGSKAAIDAGKAILLPVSPRLYMEYFAPADMNQTVNTVALPYYASREKLIHDKGWSLHMQSNPLPLVMRPELVSTLAMK
ncbi:major capsid protein, partial [Kingella potus]